MEKAFPVTRAEDPAVLPLVVQVFGIYLSRLLVALLHAADGLGLLLVKVQDINHILPFFRKGAGTYSLN